MNDEQGEMLDYLIQLIDYDEINKIEKKAGTDFDNIELEFNESKQKYRKESDFQGEIPVNMFVRDKAGKKRNIGTLYFHIEQKNPNFDNVIEGSSFDDRVEESYLDKVEFKK